MITNDTSRKNRLLREISDQEDSPCYECLVKSACSRQITNHDACDKYIDYIFEKIQESKNAKK